MEEGNGGSGGGEAGVYFAVRAAVLLLSSLNYSMREVWRVICARAARSFPSADRFTVSADGPTASVRSALPMWY